MAAVVVAAGEAGRFHLISLLLVPLYTRLRREAVLDNFTRGQIYGHILTNPGSHYTRIKGQLRLSNGATAYHLRTLERERYIRSVRSGPLLRFFPTSMELSVFADTVEERLFVAVLENPDCSQKEVAKRCGIDRALAGYHLRRLRWGGVLLARRDGSRHRYRVDPEFLLDDTDRTGRLGRSRTR